MIFVEKFWKIILVKTYIGASLGSVADTILLELLFINRRIEKWYVKCNVIKIYQIIVIFISGTYKTVITTFISSIASLLHILRLGVFAMHLL